MSFHFDRETRRRLGYRLIDLINDYFESLPSRGVQLPKDERTFGQLTERMPEFGADADAVLEDICHELVEKGFHVPAANYFGLMNPTPTYMAVLAEALVAALNPQLATLSRSQLASKIESETVRWIGERVGWPGTFDAGVGERPDPGWGGTFTSGGNEANFTALALALNHHFPGVAANGLASIGAQPVAYCSSEAHHSLDKSAGLLGIGRKALRRIPVDENVQLDHAQLVRQIEADLSADLRPFAVVATAGTTNSGAIDDLPALAEVCRKYKLWLHVDGAYGAAAIFSDRYCDLVRGIELADSVTIDPHKWLMMPFAAGVILTRHPRLLQSTFEVTTPYMPRTEGAVLADNFKVSTQWSRRMNSLKLYLTLRVHGREAYEQIIGRQLELARRFSEWAQQSGVFELAAPQRLPIVNLRLRGLSGEERQRQHQRIADEVTASGQRWISVTRVAGESVIRLMVISYLTEERHLQELQQALMAAVQTGTPAAERARGR